MQADRISRRAGHAPAWSQRVLLAAGIYNLAWGLLVIAWPAGLFQLADMELPRYPQIWQCVGMIVGVYGVGYLIAARDPYRHWPITLVGLLGKVFGPLGFAAALWQGTLPLAWGWTIVTNDLIWWIPFSAILYGAFRAHCDTTPGQGGDFDAAVEGAVSHRGVPLADLSRRRPTLVVFLRHAGCTFCREALADLAAARARIEEAGQQIALGYLSEPMRMTRLCARYDLDDVHRFYDPECRLYEAFCLERGRFGQLFGWRVWCRAPLALLRYGIGRLSGDGFRMPGAFVIADGKLRAAYRHRSASDRPDYANFARTAARPTHGTEAFGDSRREPAHP